MSKVIAYLENKKIILETELDGVEFLNEFKYLKANGTVYRIEAVIKDRNGMSATFLEHKGPVEGKIKHYEAG